MGSWPWTRAWHCSVLHVAGAGLGWSTVCPTVLLSHDQVLHHQSREWSGVVAGLVRSGWKLMMLVGGQGWSVISNSSVVTWATWDQWYSSSSWLQDHKSWHKVTMSASLSSILTEHWNSKMCYFYFDSKSPWMTFLQKLKSGPWSVVLTLGRVVTLDTHLINYPQVSSCVPNLMVSSLILNNVINITSVWERCRRRSSVLMVSCLRLQILTTSFVTIPSMLTVVPENMFVSWSENI